MNVKVAVAVLVAVVVAFVLVLVYGGLRPSGSAGSSSSSVESVFGGLRSDRPVTFAQVAAAPCADAATAELRPAPGVPCSVRLPSSRVLRLCALEGAAAVTGTVKGRDYPAQRLSAADVDCGAPQPFRVYDEASELTLVCLAACRLRLV
ncbi:MAG: hypothetical protein U0Q15_00145 [Kineosporiaceae bacterium]